MEMKTRKTPSPTSRELLYHYVFDGLRSYPLRECTVRFSDRTRRSTWKTHQRQCTREQHVSNGLGIRAQACELMSGGSATKNKICLKTFWCVPRCISAGSVRKVKCMYAPWYILNNLSHHRIIKISRYTPGNMNILMTARQPKISGFFFRRVRDFRSPVIANIKRPGWIL